MSKKARRRPSWGKYRQKYGKVAVYYRPMLAIHGIDAEEELAKMICEDINNQYIKYMIDRMTGNYDYIPRD